MSPWIFVWFLFLILLGMAIGYWFGYNDGVEYCLEEVSK